MKLCFKGGALKPGRERVSCVFKRHGVVPQVKKASADALRLRPYCDERTADVLQATPGAC